MSKVCIHISRTLSRLRNRAIGVCIAFALALSIPAYSAPAKWEVLKTERTDVKTVVKDSDTEIKAARGIIVIHTNKPTQVKVYTILGQLVNRETLQAGQSQLSISAHGVYIIKTPELTCKVAL